MTCEQTQPRGIVMERIKTRGLAGSFGTMHDLENEPPVNWLIPGWLAARELSCIYGKGGTFKTYIALGWSLQLCAFEGKSAVYVAAEGTSGLRSRVDAWMAQHGMAGEILDSWSYYNANILIDQEKNLSMWMNGLVEFLGKGRKTPDLVVIDTLARNFLGDENNAKEMGMFVEGCEVIRREFNTAVLPIHHEGVTTGRDRGSPALRNATFAMFQTSDAKRETRIGGSVSLECNRMKDATIPESMRVYFKMVGLDTDVYGDVYRRSYAMDRFPPRKHK